MKFETDPIRKEQAAQEAVELLRRAGFVVEDYDSHVETTGSVIDLDLRLMVDENERPLEALD